MARYCNISALVLLSAQSDNRLLKYLTSLTVNGIRTKTHTMAAVTNIVLSVLQFSPLTAGVVSHNAKKREG